MTTTTAPRPRIAERVYHAPTRDYLLRLLDDMRDHDDKARRAMAKWSERDAHLKTRVSLRALSRGWVDWQYEVALQAEKDTDPVLADCWTEYTFHRDEHDRVALDLGAETALFVALGGAR